MIARKTSVIKANPFSDEIISGLLNATKAAALAAYDWIGHGDEKAADQAAVNAMRFALNEMMISGRIAIGEGERDQAPMLYIGEKVGCGSEAIDIALDPLEGTTLCAHGADNSIAVLAATEKEGFLHAPDVYMKKIAIGSGMPTNLIKLDASVYENLQAIASYQDKKPEELVVCVLNRPRHETLIKEIRTFGARIRLIKDGDILAALATCLPQTGIDVYMGIGGAPEGVLAAAALKALGGQIQGQLLFHNDIEKKRAFDMGITDLDAIYQASQMVKGEAVFCATGVTDGELLQGVRKEVCSLHTHSLIIKSNPSSLKMILEQDFIEEVESIA